MQEEQHRTKENFKNIQRQGKQSLRLLLLFFLLFLFVYYIVGYPLLERIVPEAFVQEANKSYLIFNAIECVLWLIVWMKLWKYTRVGRWLFTIFSIIILYFIKDMLGLFSFPLETMELQMIRWLFCLMMVLRDFFALFIVYKVFKDTSIRCIWAVYDEGDKDTNEQASDELSLVVRQGLLETYEEEESKLNRRAERFLKTYVWKLIGLTYGSFLLLYLLLFYLQYSFPSDIEGLQYVQRMLLLSSLFTILIWSLPLITMFLRKRCTRILLPLTWGCEIVRFSLSISEEIHTFQTQRYGWVCVLTMIVLELLRYGLLFKFTLSFYKNPFMKVYWEKQAAILHEKNKVLNTKNKV